MAGGERRVAPGRGFLLLCILTLHFSSWNPVASEDLSSTPAMLTVITPSVLETSPVSSTSMVSNHSANGTEDTPLTCQSFQCSGDRCYQDEAYANDTVTCHNESHCQVGEFSAGALYQSPLLLRVTGLHQRPECSAPRHWESILADVLFLPA
ncbi:uncharacterized protein ACDP82_017914 [Pangshura tecta]